MIFQFSDDFDICSGFEHTDDVDITRAAHRDGFVISSRSKSNICLVKFIGRSIQDEKRPLSMMIDDAEIGTSLGFLIDDKSGIFIPRIRSKFKKIRPKQE